MFTPPHILCNSNRITFWQMVICGIPSFLSEDFLFPLSPSYIKKKKKKKKVSVFSSPWRFDYRSPSGFFGADLCEGPDKAEQGLVMQACGSAGEIIIIHKGITPTNTVSLHRQMSHGQRRTRRPSYTLNDRFPVVLRSQPRATSLHCMHANHFLKYPRSIFFVS